MLGYLLSTVLLMAFGYVYPAYQCYKEMEKNEIKKEQILFWCRYWILVAVLVVVESFSDVIISWLPLYGESKLAFVIYLWHPKTQGANYVYSVMLRPIVMQHEKEIDKRIMEFWYKGKDIAIQFMQTGFYYGQTRIFEIIHYLSTQAAAGAPAPPASADKGKEKESPKAK
ncbi:putative HVA22-like protein g [Apium graveolens]